MYLFGVLNDLLIVAQMQGTQRMSYVQGAGAREATMIEALYSVIAIPVLDMLALSAAGCFVMPSTVNSHRDVVFMYTRLRACMSKLRCCVFVVHGRCVGRGRERSNDNASRCDVSLSAECEAEENHHSRRFDNKKMKRETVQNRN